MRDRRKHSAADQNFLPRIALSVGLGGASEETIAFRAKTRERLIDGLKTGADFLRIVHTGPPQMAASAFGR